MDAPRHHLEWILRLIFVEFLPDDHRQCDEQNMHALQQTMGHRENLGDRNAAFRKIPPMDFISAHFLSWRQRRLGLTANAFAF